MRLAIRFPVLMLALAAAAVSTAAATAHDAHPTSRDQPLRDGCQRPSLADFILVNSPEWVYVNRRPGIHVAEGVTRVPHPTPVDQPGTHDWYDFNGNLVPDAPYRYLVAGRRAAGTNNFSRGDADAGEEFARLHYEWEEGSLPKFAWAGDGDRTRIWGTWIWDCGHWTEGDRVTGERTEFHPLNAIAVSRANPSAARAGESETDAWISSDGTFARANLECARVLHPQADRTYGPGFFACARDRRKFQQPLAHSYSFTVRAPRRPPGATHAVLRWVVRGHRRGRAAVRVRVVPGGFRVTVSPRSRAFRWGRSYFVRWVGRVPAADRLNVTFKKLVINHADPDPGEGGADPAGEKWALYLEVNGQWRGVNSWAPSLFKAHDGMTVPLNHTIPVTLQRGRGLRVFMMGRECDGPSGVVLFGHFVPRTKPCPFNPTESKISAHNNDDPGTLLDLYSSARAALGTHRRSSKATVVFPHTGRITFFDGVQGNDAYELTYTVSRRR